MHLTSVVMRSLTWLHRFCGQDEEHDPGEVFEEWLTCNVCGDNGMLIFTFHKKHEEKNERVQYKLIVSKIRGHKR